MHIWGSAALGIEGAVHGLGSVTELASEGPRKSGSGPVLVLHGRVLVWL